MRACLSCWETLVRVALSLLIAWRPLWSMAGACRNLTYSAGMATNKHAHAMQQNPGSGNVLRPSLITIILASHSV